jgi:tRNA-dihydrouridine synthase 2
MWERLNDIVKLGDERGLPVICNGDGDGWPNRDRIREMTGECEGDRADSGASSVMLARAAERNPSVFANEMKCNVTENYPRLLKLAQYLNNPWGNTKFLLSQFKPGSDMTKQRRREVQDVISKSKTLEAVASGLEIDLEGGADVIKEIEEALRRNV